MANLLGNQGYSKLHSSPRHSLPPKSQKSLKLKWKCSSNYLEWSHLISMGTITSISSPPSPLSQPRPWINLPSIRQEYHLKNYKSSLCQSTINSSTSPQFPSKSMQITVLYHQGRLLGYKTLGIYRLVCFERQYRNKNKTCLLRWCAILAFQQPKAASGWWALIASKKCNSFKPNFKSLEERATIITSPIVDNCKSEWWFDINGSMPAHFR